MLSVMPPLAPLLFRAIDIGWFSRIGSTNAKSEAAARQRLLPFPERIVACEIRSADDAGIHTIIQQTRF
jgi:hypothetical protein